MRIYLFFLIVILSIINKGSCTDIEVTSQIVIDWQSIKIHIPGLSCYVKYSGYNRVTWYKDGLIVKNGSSDIFGHFFAPHVLINNSNFGIFKNPLEIQGYYWCETDAPPVDAVAHKFLFQIESVSTFAGFFLATQDSLGDDKSIPDEQKFVFKSDVYTSEMQEVMFAFLPSPTISIRDIKNTKNGLEVYFFLYVFPPYDARLQGDPRLTEDEHQLQEVIDDLQNRTNIDPEYFENLLQWTEFRGIDISKISLRSTIGCYEEETFNPSEVITKISWPYTFLNDIAIPEESCTTKDGLPVVRECKGSFNEGVFWDSIVGTCENEASALTESLKQLSERLRQLKSSVSLEILETLIKDNAKLSATDLVIIANILGRLTLSLDFEMMEEDNIFTAIDTLLKADSGAINIAKTQLQFTNRILQTINIIIDEANSRNMMLEISKSTMLAFTRGTDVGDSHINGAFVTTQTLKSTLEESEVTFLTNGSGFPYQGSKAGFLLPTELIIKREMESKKIPCQLNMVFFKDWILFNDPLLPGNFLSANAISTPVMMISISGGPVWNLNYPVQLFFKHEFQGLVDNPTCVYFDPKRENEGAWATEGCSYEGLNNGFHVCHCHHLSIFSIIMAEKITYKSPIFDSHLSLYVGCGISMVGLVIVVIFYIVSNTWRQTIDQDILFQISLSFLCSLILLVTHEVHPTWEPGCLLLSHAFFCYVLAMFCWIFIQSIVYYIRFSKKAETSDISHFLTKCAAFAYGFPIVVIAVIGLSRNYGYYKQETCWPTLDEVSDVAIIPVIIVLAVAMYFCLNATYSISCRYKNDLLVGTPKYIEDALKFRAAITLFVVLILSWLFGYLALWHKQKEMQILFSIFIIVSSLYIAFFFIFHEMSLGELLTRKKNTISEPIVKTKGQDKPSYGNVEN